MSPTAAHVRSLARRLGDLEEELSETHTEYEQAVARSDITAAAIGERFEYVLHDYEALVDRMTSSPLWPDSVAALRELAKVNRPGDDKNRTATAPPGLCSTTGKRRSVEALPYSKGITPAVSLQPSPKRSER